MNIFFFFFFGLGHDLGPNLVGLNGDREARRGGPGPWEKSLCLINESGPSPQVGSGYEKTQPVAIPTFVHDLVEELLIHQYIIFKRNRYSSVRLIERGSERVFFVFVFVFARRSEELRGHVQLKKIWGLKPTTTFHCIFKTKRHV